MAHHIYTTEGFVLGGIPSGEANSYLYVFTRELGLVGASARAVRDIKSKLRYGLQDFSHCVLSLVRGKNEWKITNAVPKENIYYTFALEKEKFMVCAHALSLIKKLVAGEEKNEKLFDILNDGFSFLEKNDFTRQQILHAESLMMLRIVYNLGYLTNTSVLAPFVKSNDWNIELVEQMPKHHTHAVAEINKAIRESQL